VKLSGGLPSGKTFSPARSGGAGRILDLVMAWTERYRQRVMLAEMEPHIRRDLGLSPADIDQECSKPFWRA
jgi:uncharacterized protein YjiS (DUF1127 family)